MARYYDREDGSNYYNYETPDNYNKFSFGEDSRRYSIDNRNSGRYGTLEGNYKTNISNGLGFLSTANSALRNTDFMSKGLGASVSNLFGGSSNILGGASKFLGKAGIAGLALGVGMGVMDSFSKQNQVKAQNKAIDESVIELDKQSGMLKNANNVSQGNKIGAQANFLTSMQGLDGDRAEGKIATLSQMYSNNLNSENQNIAQRESKIGDIGMKMAELKAQKQSFSGWDFAKNIGANLIGFGGKAILDSPGMKSKEQLEKETSAMQLDNYNMNMAKNQSELSNLMLSDFKNTNGSFMKRYGNDLNSFNGIGPKSKWDFNFQ